MIDRNMTCSPRTARRSRRAVGALRGFTLIELMIVVLIIGILAAIAGPLYSAQKYRAMSLEASEVLSQIVNAQESYRAEFNMYSDTSNDLSLSASATDGSSGGLGVWWPSLGAPAASATSTVDFYASLPASWNQLGMRPRQLVRYSYQSIAGNPGVTPSVGASGSLGYTALPAAQQGQWFYATASADLDHDGLYSRFEITSFTRIMQVTNETE